MNINELNRIKTINIEAAVEGAERGSGTFKEILDNVMSNVIVPLTINNGMIVGMSFDTHCGSVVEDCIEQRKFEIRYSGKPIMDWVLKALELKADGKHIAEVIENAEGIKVVTDQGEVIEIESYNSYRAPSMPTIELPSEVDIDCEQLESSDMKEVKKYLRNTYGHYLSGFAGDPDVEVDEDENVVHVSNISWGRKI